MRSKRFLFLSGGLGAGSCLTRFPPLCAGRRTFAGVRERPRASAACPLGRCNLACFERVAACVGVGVGNLGSVCAELDRGMVLRAVGVGNGG